MSDRSSIEWTDATWNPIRAEIAAVRGGRAGVHKGWHCVKVSPGCANCYAERMNLRLGTGERYTKNATTEAVLDEEVLCAPLRWKKPRMIFVCSMTDLFGVWVRNAWIDEVFAIMALCPQHTFQVLTKRAARMRAYVENPISHHNMEYIVERRWFNHDGRTVSYKRFLPNVWLGVSCEDQERANERIPELIQTPAAVRWVSCEPLLERIQFKDVPGLNTLTKGPQLDWVVVGGESGRGARPMHPLWVQSLRDQCKGAGVPFFFKQWGEWLPTEQFGGKEFYLKTKTVGQYEEAFFRSGSAALSAYKCGKKRAGRYLDGEIHDGMPSRTARAANNIQRLPVAHVDGPRIEPNGQVAPHMEKP